MALDEWQTVASSNIAAASYEEESNTLGVQFLDGSEYHFHGVPAWMHDGLRDAMSVGRYFRQWIRGKFDGAKA